jgi:hypothetical protein
MGVIWFRPGSSLWTGDSGTYRWPTSPWLRLPARLLASSYERWCCRQAVKDAVKLAS